MKTNPVLYSTVFMAVLLLISCAPIHANWMEGERPTAGFPRFGVGIGTYVQGYDANHIDGNWAGLTLRGSAYFTEHLATRLQAYSTEADIVNSSGTKTGSTEINGFTISALAGTNWGTGFNFFAGLGMYSENIDWEETGMKSTDSWSGFTISYGFGYRWETLSLELSGELRDSTDPDDFFGSTVDETYAAGSLALEALF